MPNGIITIMKIGVLYDMMISVVMTVKKDSSAISNVIGSSLSMVSISNEKRLTIRPVGVVSKKDIGDRTML